MINKFADRLKSLLLEEQITAYKLAKDISVSQSVITYWLQGKTTPNIDYVIIIADYFNVTTDYLLGYEKEDGGKIYIEELEINQTNNIKYTRSKSK